MFDQDHGAPLIDDPIEDVDEGVDIGRVQARRRLIENEDRRIGAEGDGELEALALTARQRGEGLADAQVPEADRGDALRELRGRSDPRFLAREELGRPGGRQVEDVGDRQTAETVFEDRGVEAAPLTGVAGR